jgi:hypothetical protein
MSGESIDDMERPYCKTRAINPGDTPVDAMYLRCKEKKYENKGEGRRCKNNCVYKYNNNNQMKKKRTESEKIHKGGNDA